jgi:hypothetical protein
MSNVLRIHECPLKDGWDRHKAEFEKMTSKVGETHIIMNQILQHTQHLSKLDALEDIRDSLLESATGRNHLETKTAMVMFKILGAVIATLLLTILYLLTGQHFNLLTLFHP